MIADSITVDAPAPAIWAVYTDVERWPEWTASVTDARLRPQGGLALETTASIKQPWFPRVVWTVTELDEERRWIWANRAPGARAVAGHELTPLADGSTRVDLWIDQRGALGRPIGWAAARITRRYLRLEAEGLRRRVESSILDHPTIPAGPRNPATPLL